MEFLSQAWQTKLADLLASSDRSLLVATPFIKHEAAEWVLETLERRKHRKPQTTVITDISAGSVLGGSLDIEALLLFADGLRNITIFDVRRLHAKVYVDHDPVSRTPRL